MRSVDLDRLTIASLARALVARQLSPIEVTEACLARIDRLDPRLNSFITPTAERALADARQAEAEILRGEYRGPLHGVPLALKDIFATRGIRTTCGARVLRDWVPARDATVVQRLSDAGAVLLGKLNMSEFAYGAVHPDYPLPRNPWCQDRFTGGSSSGSGGAVAAGLCFGSLGTDTGGSVRQPAAYCGIVGLKPSYGVVSRAGVVPLSWSLDHVGPMARTAEDVGLLLDAIAGLDPTDASSIRLPRARPDTLDVLTPDVRKSRVGLVADSLRDPTAPEVITCVREAVRVLEPLVARIEEVTLPHADAVAAAWSAICLPEASAYHGQLYANGRKTSARMFGGAFRPVWPSRQCSTSKRSRCGGSSPTSTRHSLRELISLSFPRCSQPPRRSSPHAPACGMDSGTVGASRPVST